jgi:hypothetical protein
MWIMEKCPDCDMPHVRDCDGNEIEEAVVLATIPIPVIMNAMAMLAQGAEAVGIGGPDEDDVSQVIADLIMANKPLGGFEL